MAKKLTWSTVKVKLGNLKEWDKNPVKISERDARELAKSIDKFDHVIPYVAAAPLNGKKELPLLDGHQRKRVELTLRAVSAETLVEVRVPSRKLTEKERAEIAVRLRKNTGTFDDKKLLEWFEADDLLDWGFDQDELEDIGFAFEDESRDTEPEIDRAEELLKKWKVKTGDLWQLGEHRLICGDSTDETVVRAVMGEERCNLYLTDAPYGVSYADKNRFLNAIGRPNSVEEPIENDHQTVDEMSALWLAAFKTAYEFCVDGCVYYICSPQGGELMMMMMMIREAGFLLKHSIIWVKNQFVIGRSDYHYKHEPLLYGWKKGAHKFYGNRGESSVWEIDKPRDSNDHPTMKPVGLFEKAIKNSSQEGEIVLDGFLGSGTTLIACENLSRRCRAIEISPAYCAVTLERFYEHTGILPKLVKK